MPSVFNYLEYKNYLEALIEESQIKGFQTRLAEAAQCQRAYFSRVMKGDAHLTLEQAYGIAKFLNLTGAGEDYFLDTISYARAGTPELRAKIKKRLIKMKAENEQIKNRLKAVPLGDGLKEGMYYSSWHWAAVHIATGIPTLQTPPAIAQHLGISILIVQSTLEVLEKFGLVKHHKGRWSYSSNQLHLPKESIMTTMNHANWRHKALMDMQRPSTDGLHYSVVHSHAAIDFERLKELLLSTINHTRKIVDPSPSEILSCVTLDCFKL